MSTKKLIMAIVGAEDTNSVLEALTAHQYAVTQMGSMGGFLRRGSTTMMVGVEQDQVESALDVIRFACRSEPKEDEHRATIFVLNAPLFEQF